MESLYEEESCSTCQCNQPINVSLAEKLNAWVSNYLVIIIIGLIIFVIVTMILYWMRPSVVLDNALEGIDNARLILTSFIISMIILIILWAIVKYILHSLTNKVKEC
jgi:Na+-driven multidrug efflux pump